MQQVVGGRSVVVLFAVGDEAVHFPRAYPARPMGDLPVQIGQLDHVPVHEAQRAHPGAGEVRRGRAPEAAGADDEDAGGLEAFLAWKLWSRQQNGSLEGGQINLPLMPTWGSINCLP